MSPVPLLVTGLPRSGTSWTGKMLQASGQVVYINEPLNPRRPPGRSPGVLNAQVQHRFQYIAPPEDAVWKRAYQDTLRLRYRLLAEVPALRKPYDVGRMIKYASEFTLGALRHRHALLDDPYATFSARWLSEQMGVRTVMLVRDPVGLLGSWKQLGWRVELSDLLGQPLLMRDHLEPWREELERAAAGDWIDQMCALWNVTQRVVDGFRSEVAGLRVWRYEQLAGAPMEQFAAMYEWMGLEWSPDAQRIVREATSSTSESKGFSWSLRGGVSRTAFRPMDSTAAVQAAAGRLTAEETSRVRDATAEVAARFV